MEFGASVKPLKPSSNISDMVSKLAKACKIRSIGVFSTPDMKDDDQVYQIISSNNGAVFDEEDSNADKEAAFDALSSVKKMGNVCGDVEILKLFGTLLDFKLAYIKLQEAHIPFDPEKIRAADEEVVFRLDSLCKIKKAYKEKLLKEAESDSACSTLLLAEIKVKERILEKLKSQVKNKEKDVTKLCRELQELEMRNEMMAEKILQEERESFRGLDHKSFENVVKTVGRAIHDFAKPLIALMKHSDWDLDEAADVIQTSVAYAKRSHRKYAFEAYIARRMFQGFTPQTSFSSNIMGLDDPIVALMEDPQSSFAKFCKTKYLSVVHPKMESSFFSNLDHRNFVANGIHPHTPFYCAFVRMARCAWYLLVCAAFMEPKAELFGVRQGSNFSDVHMEVVQELKEYKSQLDRNREKCKVEFMVMPGFKIGEALVRSQVYVSKQRSSSGRNEESPF